MQKPPDFSLRIPVVCNEAGKFAGKCYMEKISSVRMLNGESVLRGKNLRKCDFKTGDVVTIRYQTKDFRGTVDFGRVGEDILDERVESPFSTRSFPPQTTEPDSERLMGSKLKRHRSWEGHKLSQLGPTKRKKPLGPDEAVGRGSSKAKRVNRNRPGLPGIVEYLYMYT